MRRVRERSHRSVIARILGRLEGPKPFGEAMAFAFIIFEKSFCEGDGWPGQARP